MIKAYPVFKSSRLFSLATENGFCYLYLAIFTYIIPKFNPLPTSLLTIGTFCGLLLFMGRSLVFLNIFRGNAKRILFGYIALVLIQIPLNFISDERDINFLFVCGFFLIILITGRAIAHRDKRVLEKLVLAYGVILLASMFWFLMTYFSNTIYDIHIKLFQISDPYILYIRQRSGLTPNLHFFGYHLAVLSMFLITSCFASNGKRRVIFMMLTAFTGIAILFAGERSVIAAIACGVVALFFKAHYRMRKLPLALLFTAIFTLSVFCQNPIGWGAASNQRDLVDRFQSDALQSETTQRFQLQWEGLMTIFEYPEGLVLAGKKWAEVIYSRDHTLFFTWGRVIAVHNGYLGTGIQNGLPVFVLIVLVFYWLARLALTLLSVKGAGGISDWLCTALGSALLASLVQAMFHNASFVTLEGSSVIVVMLSMAAYSRLIINRPIGNSL